MGWRFRTDARACAYDSDVEMHGDGLRWEWNELEHAGQEHLDPSYVASY